MVDLTVDLGTVKLPHMNSIGNHSFNAPFLVHVCVFSKVFHTQTTPNSVNQNKACWRDSLFMDQTNTILPIKAGLSKGQLNQ